MPPSSTARPSVRSAGVGVAIAVLVLAGCGSAASVPAYPGGSAPAAASVAAGSPPVMPSATPGTPDGTVAFASERYGYRLAVPAGWTAEEVPGAGGLHAGEPGVDTFRDRKGHQLVVVGEPALTLGGWTCAIGKHLVGEHRLTPERVENVVVAGQPARLTAYHLLIKPYVTHYLTVEVVSGGRGLTLSMESTTGQDDEDRRLLDGLLASLELPG